jgi:four helix bundle protein
MQGAAARRVSVNRFEDLRVWQAAREQCDRVGKLRKRPEFVCDAPLSDQINRASVSVMFNISEGFLRRIDRETAQFLRYAFASNGEVKCGYYAAEDRKYIGSDETAQLLALNDKISRMLRRWQSSLDIKHGTGSRTKDKGRPKDDGPSTD